MKTKSILSIILCMIICLFTSCSTTEEKDAADEKNSELASTSEAANVKEDSDDKNEGLTEKDSDLVSTSSDENEKEDSDELNNEKEGLTVKEIAAKYESRGYPIAVIEMENGGTIVLELYDDIAPNTVYNFISLANSGFYDGLIFHRIIQGFMIQGGDPNGNGTGGPGYNIKGEFTNNGFDNTISHTRGTISMGRRGHQLLDYMFYDTAGCQFFICDADSVFLDGNYASFGRVVEGIEVVDEIAKVAKDANDKPYKDQIMKSVYVETFGKVYPEPERLPES